MFETEKKNMGIVFAMISKKLYDPEEAEDVAVTFKGEVHLQHTSGLSSAGSFTGTFEVFESFMFQKATDIVIPISNVAYLDGKTFRGLYQDEEEDEDNS